MGLGTNVKHLRKDNLKLSRVEFGKMLGVSADVINNIELERLARPEQKEPLLRLICETFNVNYEWLTTGQGPMYVETKETFVAKLSDQFRLSDTAQKIIECYLNLDESQRAAVDGFIMTIAESLVKGDVESTEPEADVVDDTINRMELYRAARSTTNTEHEIIQDGQGTIQKLKNLPKVTDKDDF